MPCGRQKVAREHTQCRCVCVLRATAVAGRQQGCVPSDDRSRGHSRARGETRAGLCPLPIGSLGEGSPGGPVGGGPGRTRGRPMSVRWNMSVRRRARQGRTSRGAREMPNGSRGEECTVRAPAGGKRPGPCPRDKTITTAFRPLAIAWSAASAQRDTVEPSHGWGPRLGFAGVGGPALLYRCCSLVRTCLTAPFASRDSTRCARRRSWRAQTWDCKSVSNDSRAIHTVRDNGHQRDLVQTRGIDHLST
jgi:hypothetical protein